MLAAALPELEVGGARLRVLVGSCFLVPLAATFKSTGLKLDAAAVNVTLPRFDVHHLTQP